MDPADPASAVVAIYDWQRGQAGHLIPASLSDRGSVDVSGERHK